MPEITVSQDGLARKRVACRAKLNEARFDIPAKLRVRNGGENHKHISESLEDYLAVQEAVWDVLGSVFRGGAGQEFSQAFAARVAAERGLEALCSENGHAGYTSNFFYGNKVNFANTYPEPFTSMLSVYSSALDMRVGKTAEELTREFFDWVKQESVFAEDAERFSKYRVHMEKNPLVIGGKTYRDGTARLADNSVLLWEDIGGYETVKRKFQEIAVIIQHLDSGYALPEVLLPKGVLLSGPPGTGKTTLAKTMCYQAGVPFEMFSAADIGSSYVNQTSLNLQAKFDKAAQKVRDGHPASILFIDEIDIIAQSRYQGNSKEDDKLVVALNVNMDGARRVAGVLVIGATNRLHTIDSAIIRPGRFSEIIEMGYPDASAIRSIYEVTLRKRARESRFPDFLGSVDYDALAAMSEGFTGAEIDGVVSRTIREKYILHIRQGKPLTPITTQDIRFMIQAYAQQKKVAENAERR